jgi:uncharacterized protein YndB with AHSA1/START domain
VRTSIEAIVEVEIGRARLDVWSFLSDAERMPEWIGELRAVRQESEGALGLGTVVRYTLDPGNRSGTFEIVEWDPPRRLAWEGPPLSWAGGGLRPRGSHELAEAGEGRTLLVSRYHPEVIGMAVLLRPYLKRWLRRERSASAQALKLALEAEGA